MDTAKVLTILATSGSARSASAGQTLLSFGSDGHGAGGAAATASWRIVTRTRIEAAVRALVSMTQGSRN